MSAQTPFQTRIAALQVRVTDAAIALHEQGIRPSVQRIRAALGGGSPNDLTPALRHWREEVLPTLTPLEDERSGPPLQVADLMRELWTRALAAASIDKKGGDKAIALLARSEEVRSLREQISSLRDRLEREAIAYGELRAQAARHEAIAKEALARARTTEHRERVTLFELGEAKQRVAGLLATAKPAGRRGEAPDKLSRRRTPKAVVASARAKPKTRRAGTAARKPAKGKQSLNARRRR